MQEDGTPAPRHTRVECACSSGTKKSATLDSRGFFSIQIGGNARFASPAQETEPEVSNSMDAPSERGGATRLGLPAWLDSMASDRLAGCEVSAAYEGFRSSIVNLEGSRSVGQIEIGVVVLYPVSKVTGTLVSVTTLRAPKAARKALERAVRASRKKESAEAERNLDEAVRLYPRYAEAWFALGQLHERQRHIQEARTAYQKAVGADELYVKPYIALARLAGVEQRWKIVEQITDHAITLDPLDFPEAYYLNSLACYRLKIFNAAEKSARRVLLLDPLHRFSAAYLVLAEVLEQKHDIAGTIEQLHKYIQIAPDASSAGQVRAHLEKLEQSQRASGTPPASEPQR
jgi:tetratricopeptide (TPR) repeat protein